ncbi:MAG: PAS domain S-box protein [Candidatus Sulfotelmatobacter sp.]
MLVPTAALAVGLNILRCFLLPQSYEATFTDIFEAAVVLPGALACGFAAARSSRITRGLWAMAAAYLALNAAADVHDFLVDVHFGGATILSPLEFLGWCTYLPLAVLIFFPTSKEGRGRFGWLPAVDFTQVVIVIVLAYFRLIYLHHVDLGRGWQEFGRPEVVRNALIASGLLLRALVEPSSRARAVYRMVSGAFATIVLLNIIVHTISPIVRFTGGRPAALMAIGIVAAYWKDRPEDETKTARPATRLRLALSVFAAAPPIAVLWLVHSAPARYQGAMYGIAAASIVLFILRSAVADHARYVTENELRKSEREYRVLFENAIIPIVIFEPYGERILQANAAACELYEVARGDLVGACLKDFTKDVDLGEKQIAELLRTGVCPRFETVHRTGGGREIDVSVSSSVIQYRGHEAILSFNRDISDRKRADVALRASEDKYRDLVEHSEDLVCTHDLEGRLLSVNPAPARVLGYEVTELLKTPMREIVAPEFRQQFDAYLARIKRTGAEKGLMCVLTRNGERRIWEYSNTLRTEGVASPVVRGMAHDVTERKQAEGALRRSEKSYRLLFEKNIAGVAVSSMDGRVLDCNDGWAHILGYDSAEEVRGQPTTKFYFNPADRERLLHELRQGASFFSREMQLRRKDDTPVWVLFSCVVLSADDGTPIVQATMIDISVRKRAEEALRESEERFRSVYENSTIGIYRTTPDGKVLLANPSLVKMLGFSSFSELSDRNLKEEGFEPGYERAEFQRRLASDGEVKGIEASWTKRDRTAMFVRESAKAIRNAEGEIAYYEGTVEDITEHKRAQEALRLREEDYRRFVAQSSEGIFRQDLDEPIPVDLPEDELVHGILYGSYLAECNDAIAKMYGLESARDVLGKRLTETLDASDPHNIELTREYIRSGFRIVERESHEVDIHGNPKVFLNSLTGIVQNGKLIRTWGIQRDVTKRVQAEEAKRKAEHDLTESEERFRVAIQNSPMTVFCQDRNLRYTWVYNPHLFVQQAFIGKTDDELIGADKARTLNEIKRRVLETGTGVRDEVVIPYNGKKYSFDVTLEPLRDASGGVVGITGAAMDIARLRELADGLQKAKERLVQEKQYLESEIQAELGFEHIIGQSPALREVLKNARVVAPTDSTVLLLGETGTGKELVARAIHSLSGRQDKNFIKLNCAAVPTGLLESELFGHEKGAFTGAVNQKVGRLELADKGTMFLDEIGELPLELQPKLLRVLQDREFERLGGIRTLRVDVRVISATNRDLRKDVAEKKFREDLFYRLNVFPISMPPLRERRSDIPVLIHHFVEKHAVRMSKRIEIIPDETVKALQNWSWPGNIRELENMIERMVILTKGEVLAAPPLELNASQNLSRDDLKEMGREHIIRILQETRGVLSGEDGAASRLGIKRTTLQSMLKRFGIEPEEFRRGTGTFGPD